LPRVLTTDRACGVLRSRRTLKTRARATVWRIAVWAALGWATELRALETARTRVEAEYFEGTSTLYPATIRRWTEQRELSDGLVELVWRLAEIDDLDPLLADDPAAFEARVRQLFTDHIERAKALDEVGDGRGAVRIAICWLAPKLG
jgi:hypothetical protein